MRQIIIVDVEPTGNGEHTVVGAFWFRRTVSSSRPMLARKTSSVVPNVTKSELEALQSGAIVERVVRTGALSASELTTITSALEEMYVAELASLSAEQATHVLIGREWDGNAWSPARGTFEPPPKEAEPVREKPEVFSPDVVEALGKLGAKLDDLIELTGEKR